MPHIIWFDLSERERESGRDSDEEAEMDDRSGGANVWWPGSGGLTIESTLTLRVGWISNSVPPNRLGSSINWAILIYYNRSYSLELLKRFEKQPILSANEVRLAAIQTLQWSTT